MGTQKEWLLRGRSDSAELTFGGDNVRKRDAVEVFQLNAFGFGEYSFQFAERLDRADLLGRHTFQQV